MAVRIGRLRNRIQIQTYTESRNDHGQVLQEWSTAATRWGGIEPLKSDEIIAADKIEGRVTHKIILRYYEGLSKKNRLCFDSRYFNIFSIVNRKERDKVHEILAREDDQ